MSGIGIVIIITIYLITLRATRTEEHHSMLSTLLVLLVSALIFLCNGESAHAFLPVVPRGRSLPVIAHMAKPGQSDAQQRQERENEIRSTLAKLKSAGRVANGKKGGDLSQSMVDEAEAFFNKESPVRKFERQAKERKAREAAALLENEGEEEDSVG